MVKYNDVVFYSKERNILLAKQVKEILLTKERGVSNLDDIDEIFINNNLSFRYLILDFSKSILDDKILNLLRKMLKNSFIQEIIILADKNISKYSDFIFVTIDENFYSNFSKMFDNIIENEVNKIQEVVGVWRKLISQQLSDWGFASNTTGYLELIDCIIYYTQRKGVIRNLNKEGYVYLGNKYRATPNCVELSVRKAIKMASLKKDKFPSLEKFTNKAFITYAVSQLYDSLVENNVLNVNN